MFFALKYHTPRLLVLLFLSTGTSFLNAANFQSITSGNWNDSTTWSSAGGGIPGASDNVTIRNGDIVTLTADASSQHLTITGVDNCLLCVCGCPPSELRLGSFTLTIDGSFTNNATFVANTGAVVLIGNGNITGSNGISFYNLEINTSSAITLLRDISISNRLTMKNGVFTTGINTLNGTGGITATGGTLSIAKTLTTVPELTGAYSITGGTFSFNGEGNQTLRGGDYHNIVILGSTGTKSLGGNISLTGDLSILQSTLDVSIVNNYGITISGNWINYSTFNAWNGTVTFNGNTTVSGSGTGNFNHILISGTLTGHADNMTITGNWTNNGNFIHNGGTITFNGICTVAGTSTTNFNNIIISNISTLISSITNLGVAGNWTNNGVFNHNNSGTVTFNGTNSGQILTGNTTFNHLEVNNTFQNLTLNSPVSVNGTLNLVSGQIVTTQTNVITLNNGAATGTGNANSYINGPMKYVVIGAGNLSFNFPIGKGTAWRPVVLSVDHADATSVTYTAEVINSSAKDLGYTLPSDIERVSGVRYWQIDRESVANLNSASVQLFYGADDGVNDSPNLRIVKNIGNGFVWNNIGGAGTSNTTGSITSDAFNSFSRFTLANDQQGANALPIELLSFNAMPDNKEVNISWVTASEFNNDYFDVERTADGINFEPIARVKGAGRSIAELNYKVTDSEPLTGTSYYRLKQTDFDGKYEYSDLIAVNIKAVTDFSIYPNPSDGVRTFINLSDADEREELILSVFDMNGKERYIKTINPEDMQDKIMPIEPIEKLSPGAYVVTVKSIHNISTKRLIVKN